MADFKKLKELWPHFLAIVIFITISYIYFSPVLEGKTFSGHDNQTAEGMRQEISKYIAEHKQNPLWTNSMFGGMPSYLITFSAPQIFVPTIDALLKVGPRPVEFIFLYLLGFYILLLAFRVNPWLSIVGAIAFAFSSYFFIIIYAGHTAKAIAIGYMPAIIGGVVLSLTRKQILGASICALFLALQIKNNHLQITYYTLLTILILYLVHLVFGIKEKRIKQFISGSALLLFAVMIAIGVNATTLWTTYEYGKYSMRSKSELTDDKEDKTTGLDKTYATDWSYGIGETFTLLIPNFNGGGSADGELGTNSATYELIKQSQGAAYAKKAIKQLPLYWGAQPGTSGPVYVGAIVIFLFVLGLFILKGPAKWWLVIASIFSILLAWGRNLPWLTNFFLDHFPGYNKFRTVSMTLVIAELTIPLLGILALKEVFENKIPAKDLLKSLKYSFYIVGGICLFFALFPGMFFDFTGGSDEYYLSQGATQFVDALKADRQHLLSADAFRSLVFVVIAFVIIYLFIKQKLKLNHALVLTGAFILFDMWPVDKRYISNEDFITKKDVKNIFTPTKADEYILADKDPNYRVLNLAVSTFNDASTSYYHKSIGGYHGAKMKRYQELIENHIYNDIQLLSNTFNSLPPKLSLDSTMAILNSTMAKLKTLNMLNTRYIIYNPEASPLINKHVLGNAWFVKNYQMVENADAENKALYSINPALTAVIDNRFSGIIDDFKANYDSTAQIALLEYQPNYLKYQSNSNKEQMAVFSEIYYDKGWDAFIDGNPSEYFRINYVLRGMIIPEGNHIIEFKFEPKSYYTGNKISKASSIAMILLLLLGFGFEIYKSLKPKTETEEK
ncbi:MAG: YfhO family protein [Bacteroidales bacterium]|nr:YfhO family protein [Bacteroidales bacterium]